MPKSPDRRQYPGDVETISTQAERLEQIDSEKAKEFVGVPMKERKEIAKTLLAILQTMKIDIDRMCQNTEYDPSLIAAGSLKNLFNSMRKQLGLNKGDIEIEHSPQATIKPMRGTPVIEIQDWHFWVEFDQNYDLSTYRQMGIESKIFTVRFKRIDQENEEPGSDEPSNESPTYAQPHDPNPSSSESDVPEPFREFVLL